MANRYKTRQELEDEDSEKFKKKQEEMLERRRAKHEAEGFKCTTEGCGQSFKEYFDLQSHLRDHQDEFRKNMQCSQSKCGQKFNNRRAYNEHVDIHKSEAKVKIMSNIRSVLLLNKHGLLMAAFEREFKSMMGRQVPYKLCGFNSSYDLVTSIPEVVQVTQLDDGETLLLAVPDKSTEHIAKMVGNQLMNKSGFNWETGEVLATVGRDVLKRIEKVADRSNRVVSDFTKKQIEQLMDEEAAEGLYLNDFREIYDYKFGYKLEFWCYGFHSIEDFCFHGLSDVADLELDGLCWKLVKAGFSSTNSSAPQYISHEAKYSLKKLLEENPFGMSVPTFVRLYEELFGQLEFRQNKCKNVVEMCLTMPDVCVVDKSFMGEVTILPVGHKVAKGRANGKKMLPMWVLGEVKNNIWKVLKSLSSDVPIATFARGYEGLYGCLNLPDLECQNMMELCRLMPDVCSLRLGENGQYAIGQVKSLVTTSKVEGTRLPKVPVNVVENITRVLAENTGRVHLPNFYNEYMKVIGENIDPKKLGFPNLKTLLRSLARLKLEMVRDVPFIMLEDSPRASPADATLRVSGLLQSCWVNVVKIVNPELFYLQTDDMADQVWRLEEEMERFYTHQQAGRVIVDKELLVGELVAAVFTDTLWHRGRVLKVNLEKGVAEIFFVDHGWNAFMKYSTLRHLESQFSRLAGQIVGAGLGGLSCPGGEKHWDRKTVTGLGNIVREGRRRGWVQRRQGEEEVDLYLLMTGKSGLGQMVSVSQVLVERDLATARVGKTVGELDREYMWKDVALMTKPVSSTMALQRLVLTNMGRRQDRRVGVC